jgi:membrane protease YdiL (CAAX protease family)
VQENNNERENKIIFTELDENLENTEVYEKFSPNNPPWNSYVAILLLIVSIGLIFVLPPLLVFPYLASKGIQLTGNPDLQTAFFGDKTAVSLGLAATFLAHILTIVLAWFIVTNYKQYSFTKMLGWRWGGFKFWHGAAIIVGVYVVAVGLTSILGSQENEMSRILKSSRTAVILVAFIATFSAPIIEEVVYRGVLYSAFQRALNPAIAVLLVTLIFAGIHVGQYLPDYATILSVCILSLLITLIRAKTGNLLPCIAVHMAFNGVQSILLILEPYIPLPESLGTAPEQTASFINLFLTIKHII